LFESVARAAFLRRILAPADIGVGAQLLDRRLLLFRRLALAARLLLPARRSRSRLAGCTGAKIAPAAILIVSTPRQVASIAPMTLFSSKESIA